MNSFILGGMPPKWERAWCLQHACLGTPKT
jgi:hypothetical protein